jgi:hypothetical protein
MPEHPEIDEINRRFKPLFRYLRAGEGACPFVIDDDAAKRVVMSHHNAGRDATLIQIGRKWDGKLPLDDLAVTIRYAPFVEGTAIIYDLTDETMQGKARPFECDLKSRFARMYMLLPYQVERTAIELRGTGERRAARISFLDARGEVIEAALPFELRIAASHDKQLESRYASTNEDGLFRCELESANIAVRSCLTGCEEAFTSP